jgi:hypothetical protein
MRRIDFESIARTANVTFIDNPVRGSVMGPAIIETLIAIPVPGTNSTEVLSLSEMLVVDSEHPKEVLRVKQGQETLDALDAEVEPDVNPDEWLLSIIERVIAKTQSRQVATVR